MSQTNILVIVDTDGLHKDQPGGGNITNPDKYIAIYDDEYDSTSTKPSEITTMVTDGDLLVWSIVPKNSETLLTLKFSEIRQTLNATCDFSIFNGGKDPIVYLNNRKCVSAISDGTVEHLGTKVCGYTIFFFIENVQYSWDPFIEARKKGVGEEATVVAGTGTH